MRHTIDVARHHLGMGAAQVREDQPGRLGPRELSL